MTLDPVNYVSRPAHNYFLPYQDAVRQTNPQPSARAVFPELKPSDYLSGPTFNRPPFFLPSCYSALLCLPESTLAVLACFTKHADKPQSHRDTRFRVCDK